MNYKFAVCLPAPLLQSMVIALLRARIRCVSKKEIASSHNYCAHVAVPQTVLALKGFLLIPGFTEIPQTTLARWGSYLFPKQRLRGGVLTCFVIELALKFTISRAQLSLGT